MNCSFVANCSAAHKVIAVAGLPEGRRSPAADPKLHPTCAARSGHTTGVFLHSFPEKIVITKRLDPVPRRGGVATDDSAADSRVDIQISRSSSTSDACSVH
eukprot:6187605-Pleurochrysis_carterae.AAC.3